MLESTVSCAIRDCCFLKCASLYRKLSTCFMRFLYRHFPRQWITMPHLHLYKYRLFFKQALFRAISFKINTTNVPNVSLISKPADLLFYCQEKRRKRYITIYDDGFYRKTMLEITLWTLRSNKKQETSSK